MDVDNQSEDGEIKRSPENFSEEEEEGGETADSLDIKPPQAVVRHRKPTSHRRDEHSSRRDRRDEKERKSRHHGERMEDPNRHRDKHSSRHRRPSGEMPEKLRRSDPPKRDREPSRHERKERSTGDRVLEDLRERLLDKRRERRDEPHEYKMESSSRSRDELRINDSRGERREEFRDRREIRIVEEVPSRDRREPRMENQRSSSSHKHMVYQEVEMIEQGRIPGSREKRHKRSHKHERTKDREREREKELAHREKYAREQQAMEIEDDYEELEALAAKQQQQQHHHHHHHQQQMVSMKDPKEMTEQELRRQRLLDADREMARRKENSRLELEARRKMRGEKRHHSPSDRDPSIVDISDESEHEAANSDYGSSPKSNRSRLSEELRDPERERSDRSSSSSSDTSTDDESRDSRKDSDSGDNSDYNNPSPLSVDQLAKSDRSDMGSPGHVESNGASKTVENNQKSELQLEIELPPYFPAIQGCRSVEEYRCLNRIAEGTYGVVYRAEDRRTKEIVALKRLKMEKEKDGFPITSLREINTLLKAQHPNIVTVREIVVGSNMDKIFIVMDYVEHDLKSLMETMQTKNQYFVAREIKCLMQQLLRAVAHLHDNWILHRDLKTSNLLLSHSGILKVGDFGLAREYGSPLKQYTSIVVTLWYRAPELLLGSKEYSTPIDVWSVGCIFAELLSMKALFPGKSEIDLLNRVFKELGTPNDKIWPGYSKLPMVKKIPFATYPVNSLKQRFTMTLTDSGLDLINKFLTYNPAARITAEDALKHPYFSEAPLAIDPAMFPTWPAKSEFGAKVNASPKPPSGGKEFKELNEDDDDGDMGFHMGSKEAARQAMGGGFALRF